MNVNITVLAPTNKRSSGCNWNVSCRNYVVRYHDNQCRSYSFSIPGDEQYQVSDLDIAMYKCELVFQFNTQLNSRGVSQLIFTSTC